MTELQTSLLLNMSIYQRSLAQYGTVVVGYGLQHEEVFRGQLLPEMCEAVWLKMHKNAKTEAFSCKFMQKFCTVTATYLVYNTNIGENSRENLEPFCVILATCRW